MIQKKVCMIGAFAVGKTSLVARFVKSMFSDKYLTSVGVKIDKKVLNAGGTDVMLMLWDLAGEDEMHKVAMSSLNGAAGYLLVVDGTRRATLETALDLRRRVEEAVGPLPYVMVVNKADLAAEWEVDAEVLTTLAKQGVTVVKASAKSGEGVEQAFGDLAKRIVGTAG